MLQIHNQGHGEFVMNHDNEGHHLMINVRVHHVKRKQKRSGKVKKHVKLVTYHDNGRIIAGYCQARTTAQLNRKLRRVGQSTC